MTDQTMSVPGAPQFTIGHVLTTSFAVLGRNIVAFGIIAAIIAIPSIIVSQMFATDTAEIEAMIRQGQTPVYFSSGNLVTWVVNLLTTSLTSGALVYGTFQDLRGQRASIGDALSRGLAVLLPVLLAAIAFYILLMIGFILFLIPGIMLAVALWVYVPVIVVEKKGVGEAFSRSRELTKGRRWSIFGLSAIVVVLIGAFEWGVASIFGSGLRATALHCAGIVVQVLFGAFDAVLTAVGYYYLRADKEGVAIGEIAKVFD